MIKVIEEVLARAFLGLVDNRILFMGMLVGYLFKGAMIQAGV